MKIGQKPTMDPPVITNTDTSAKRTHFIGFAISSNAVKSHLWKRGWGSVPKYIQNNS